LRPERVGFLQSAPRPRKLVTAHALTLDSAWCPF
jgi:hypothetical protein